MLSNNHYIVYIRTVSIYIYIHVYVLLLYLFTLWVLRFSPSIKLTVTI